MEVNILVTVQVDPVDPDFPEDDKWVAAAEEAIQHAVKNHEANGFAHALADDLAIGVVSVVAGNWVEEQA